jgi:hypothetical protein
MFVWLILSLIFQFLFTLLKRLPPCTVYSSCMRNLCTHLLLLTDIHQFLFLFIFLNFIDDILGAEVKFSLCLTKHHAMMYWGNGGIAPRILNLSARWRWVVSFILQPLYPWYPLDRKLGGLQSPSRRGVEEKSFYTLPRIEPRSSNL